MRISDDVALMAIQNSYNFECYACEEDFDSFVYRIDESNEFFVSWGKIK